jgi:hypothetical protein
MRPEERLATIVALVILGLGVAGLTVGLATDESMFSLGFLPICFALLVLTTLAFIRRRRQR